MKIGWGYRITLLYLGFVGLIGALVIGSMNQEVDLVADDYYEQEIRYQERIDEINRTNSLDSEILAKQENEELIISFPKNLNGKLITGSVVLFRPSDSNLDQQFSLDVNSNGKQSIPITNVQKGMYLLKIECDIEGKSYYYEKKIIIS